MLDGCVPQGLYRLAQNRCGARRNYGRPLLLAALSAYIMVVPGQASSAPSGGDKSASVLFAQGFNALKMRDAELAIQRFKSGLKLDPTNLQAEFYLADAYVLGRQLERARQLYRAVAAGRDPALALSAKERLAASSDEKAATPKSKQLSLFGLKFGTLRADLPLALSLVHCPSSGYENCYSVNGALPSPPSSIDPYRPEFSLYFDRDDRLFRVRFSIGNGDSSPHVNISALQAEEIYSKLVSIADSQFRRVKTVEPKYELSTSNFEELCPPSVTGDNQVLVALRRLTYGAIKEREGKIVLDADMDARMRAAERFCKGEDRGVEYDAGSGRFPASTEIVIEQSTKLFGVSTDVAFAAINVDEGLDAEQVQNSMKVKKSF